MCDGTVRAITKGTRMFSDFFHFIFACIANMNSQRKKNDHAPSLMVLSHRRT